MKIRLSHGWHARLFQWLGVMRVFPQRGHLPFLHSFCASCCLHQSPQQTCKPSLNICISAVKMVSNVSFREQLRSMRPSIRFDGPDEIDPRPLVGVDDAYEVLLPDGRPLWKDRHKIHKPDRSKLSAFFLSKRHTPGCNSSRPFKRSSARMWHEFKLTLLSGMCCHQIFRFLTFKADDGKIMSTACWFSCP